jgi:pilus assembly protein CpaF
VQLGSITVQASRFLEASMAAGLNVIVAGGTQAGKTTLLNSLAASIPGRERVITCEEVFELRLPLPDVVPMQTRQPNLEGTGEIPLRRLVKEALRMRPDRIIVGEVRQEECLDLLIALNSGLPGMCSIHANSAREAIVKLCTLPLLAGENVGHAFVVPTVASCVDLVVHVAKDASGHRRVREIVAVPGRVEADVVETADIFTSRGNRLVRAEGYPPHPERYEAVGADLPRLLAQEAS